MKRQNNNLIHALAFDQLMFILSLNKQALVQEAILQKQIGPSRAGLSQKPKHFNWTAVMSLTMHILTGKRPN